MVCEDVIFLLLISNAVCGWAAVMISDFDIMGFVEDSLVRSCANNATYILTS